MSRIQLRRDTSANWAQSNPTLGDGEPGVDTTTNDLKIGDGSTAWADLEFQADSGAAAAVATETTRAETAEALLVPLASKGVANGVASLNSSGLVPTNQLPAQSGGVSSVNGQTGAVTLTASDVGADASGAAAAAQTAAENATTSAITGLHLGTASTHAATDFDTSGAATAAQAAAISAAATAAGTAIQTALTQLNLGTASTHAATDFDAAGAASAAQTAAQTFTTNALSTALAGLSNAEQPAATAGSGLTHTGVGQTIGGVVVTAGMRILDTAVGATSGLWVAATGAWTRPVDFATGSNAQGKLVTVDGGQLWLCIATAAVIVGTTSQTWEQLDVSLVQAGSGLSKSGNTLSLALTKGLVTATGLAAADIGADPAGAATAAETDAIAAAQSAGDAAYVHQDGTGLPSVVVTTSGQTDGDAPIWDGDAETWVPGLPGGSAASTAYDDTASGLGASDVQDAIGVLASNASDQMAWQADVGVGFAAWASGTGWPARPSAGVVFWVGPGVSKGTWQASTAYNPWDIVKHSGTTYAWVGTGGAASPNAGTSGTTFSAANWQVIATSPGHDFIAGALS